MSTLIVILVTAAIASLIADSKMRAIKEHYEERMRLEMSKTPPNILGKTYIEEQKEEEKTIIHILEDIAYRNELDNFILTRVKNETGHYQYLKNDFLFSVIQNEWSLYLIITKDGKELLEFEYDFNSEMYDKKVISRSVLIGKSRDEALEIVEDFMEEVISYDWQEFDEDFEIVDDVKSIEEVKSEKKLGTPEPQLTKMERMIETLKENKVDEFLSNRFIKVITDVEEMSSDLVGLDMEKKHLFETVIKNDVEKLYQAYINLEENSKEEFKEQVNNGLSKIEEEIKKLKIQLKEKNNIEIKKILQLIEKRYKDA